MSYWDTSALAKLYVQEADSLAFETQAANAPNITVSETGRLELRAVLRRREAEGSLSPGSTETMHASFCTLITSGPFKEEPITPELEADYFAILDSCLSHSPPIFLRTNDGLHLAAARRANESDGQGLAKSGLVPRVYGVSGPLIPKFGIYHPSTLGKSRVTARNASWNGLRRYSTTHSHPG